MIPVDPVAGLPAGTILARRYVVLEEIGRGGGSIVYQARDTTIGREVALKLVVPPPARAREARERLKREVELVRGLRHPHVVGLHDFVEDQGRSFVVMDLVLGTDLARQLIRAGPLPVDEVVRIGTEIAGALAAAHREGILHRDVKPENVLLARDGAALLADFGSAWLEGQAALTATGALVGTLAYAAPEVVAGARGDGRSDLYALGLTLFEALAGRLPDRPAHLPPAPMASGYHPRELRPEVPEWLDAAVARATMAAPSDRFATATGLAAALSAVAPASPTPAHQVGPPLEARCMICGGPSLPGSPLCESCDPSAGRDGHRLLFVEQAGPAFYPAVSELLGLDAGLAEGGSLTDAAAGRRPLVRVRATGALALAQWLRDREVQVVARSAGGIWAAIPSAFYLLVAAVAVAGLVAGQVGTPWLAWTGPGMAGLLLTGAVLELQRPALVARPGDRNGLAFPPALRERLAALPPSPARELLAEVARLSRELVAREAGPRSRRRLLDELAPLADAAAGAAAELAALDDQLARFRNESAHQTRLPPAWWESVTRTEQARDQLTQSLLELVAALGGARTESALAFTAPGALISELTREFGERVALRTQGRLEVAAATSADH